MFSKLKASARLSTLLLLALASLHPLFAAGPDPVNLRSTAGFVILSGAAITSTGGGIINGDVGASPIAGSAIGVNCAQVNGTIYAVDASGPPCAVIDASLLTTAKGDLTTAYNDAAGRTPTPTGPNLNPGLIPGSGNIGGMNLAPGLYKFTVTAMITGTDVTFTGGPEDVWIFQCAQDLVLGSGIKIILAGGAQAKNIFWQVGTSAVLDTFSVFKGTILADQAITMGTSSTIEGRALAFSAGVTFNGDGASEPATSAEIAVQQPTGTNLVDGFSTNDFGTVLVGTNTSRTFTITNLGDADLTGLNITLDGADSTMFTVTTNAVGPVGTNSATTFTIQFAPISAGVKTAALHIASNDSDENPFDIALTGTGTVVVVGAPEIAVEQPLNTNINDDGSKDFGSVSVGSSTSLSFTLKNTGDSDLTVFGLSIDGADASVFTITAIPAVLVGGPSGSTSFTVEFAPDSAGLKTAALHIASNDGDENPFDIMITGTGTVGAGTPEIAVAQPVGANINDGGSKNFGSVLVGTNTSLTFTITNLGTADLTGLAIILDGADAGMFTVTTNAVSPVVPNGTTTFTVRFAPTSVGAKNAALHIANNDSDENPFDITITGTGTVVVVGAPEIAVAQPVGSNINDGGSKNFGSVLVGTNTSLTFTITNLGTADLTGLAINLEGADAAMFTVTTNAVSPVGPNSATTFTVRFSPTSAGAKTAALHIASNDGDENPFDITISGTGSVVVVLAPEIAVEQPVGVNINDGGSKDFSSVLVGSSSSLTFTIKNTGTADLTGLGVSINGADATLFSVTANPTTPLSGPSGTTTFTVQFSPLSVGLKTAALHIASNDSDENPFDITITGTGTAVVVVSTNLTVTAFSPITMNPQTGLFEQTVRLNNGGLSTITAARLLIQNLPSDVRVYNASGTNVSPYVLHNHPIAAGASVDLLIEYYRANRQAIPQPVFVAEDATPVTGTPTGRIGAIDRNVALPDGRFLIEFSATPGRTYAVQYSSTMTNWQTVVPTITAPANRVQWYDDGPPKTESKPTSGSRFYRIIELQ